MTEFAAALLRAQLARLEDQTMIRERNGALLNSELGKIEGLVPQRSSNRITRRAYHLYCLRIDEKSYGCSRERFVEAANAEGLPIGAGYPIPLYKQPLFEAVPGHDYARDHCLVTEDLCYRSGMWLAHQILLGSEEDMHDIAAICRKVKEHAVADKAADARAKLHRKRRA